MFPYLQLDLVGPLKGPRILRNQHDSKQYPVPFRRRIEDSDSESSYRFGWRSRVDLIVVVTDTGRAESQAVHTEVTFF